MLAFRLLQGKGQANKEEEILPVKYSSKIGSSPTREEPVVPVHAVVHPSRRKRKLRVMYTDKKIYIHTDSLHRSSY